MASFNKIVKGLLWLFLIWSTLTFGQDEIIELRKNYNFNARELRQSLNETKDSLILDSDSTIYKVQFLQLPDFKESFHPYSKQVTLPIHNLPLGRNTIAVHTNRKIILLNIEKHKELPKIEPKKQIPIRDLLNKKTLNDSFKLKTSSVKFKEEIRTGYWVVSYTDNRFSSHFLSRLVNEKTKNRLIYKNKADLKSFTGKYNRLVVWEVYDVDLFIESKIESKNRFKIVAKGFNEIPIYKSQE